MPDDTAERAPELLTKPPAEIMRGVIERLDAIARANEGRPQMGQRRLAASALRAAIDKLRGALESLEAFPRWIEEARRVGDMDPNQELRLVREGDGDVVLELRTWVRSTGFDMHPKGTILRVESRSVQFCTGQGGGRSPNVHRALCALMVAIEEDAKEKPDPAR